MINLPTILVKGAKLTFTLNKLLVLAAVASDSYWSNTNNIFKCIVVYKSTLGRQRKRLEFDFLQTTPTVLAEWSTKARNEFAIEEIVLIDFDGGSYIIPRAALPSGKGISFLATTGRSLMDGAPSGFSVIKKANGSLIGSGLNNFGQLDNGSTAPLTAYAPIASGRTFVSVHGTSGNTTGLTSDGQFWGWGYASSGGNSIVGVGSVTSTPTALAHTGIVFSQASAANCTNGTNSAGIYAIGIDANTQKCYGWGISYMGNTGQALRADGRSNTPKIIGNRNWTKVSAGAVSLGIEKETGFIYWWGSGVTATPTVLGDNRAYKDLACTHAVGTGLAGIAAFGIEASTGLLYGWNPTTNAALSNNPSIVGDGTTIRRAAPVLLHPTRQWKSVVGGYRFAAAIDSTGAVYTWGVNTRGQLGVGDTTARTVPTLISGNRVFSEITCGNNYMLALEVGTGNIYGWGNTTNGELGFVSAAPVTVPTLVASIF